MPQKQGLPDHIQATVAAITDLHAEHYRKAGRMQQMVSTTTGFLARPQTLGLLTITIVGWILINLVLLVSGRHTLDAPPFPYLADAASIVALYLTTIILITQRHDDDLATRRDQLTLELAILADQKASNIISLLEELRQQDQSQAQRRDRNNQSSSEITAPQDTLDALQAAHSRLD